jgi:hypothetical protein
MGRASRLDTNYRLARQSHFLEPQPPFLVTIAGDPWGILAQFDFCLDNTVVYVYSIHMKWNEAMDLLEGCERGLRKLVADAAGEGDYVAVEKINDLAKAISALASEGRSIAESSITPTSRTTYAASNGGQTGASTAARPAGRKTRPPVDEYPKFFRRGDELVKVGWSKSDRREYNHRAPRSTVEAAAAAVRQVGSKGKMFNGDALLPLKDPTTGSVVPDYQAYVALAWLRHLGLVEQHGRRSGYSIVPDKQIESAITSEWAELAEWRG